MPDVTGHGLVGLDVARQGLVVPSPGVVELVGGADLTDPGAQPRGHVLGDLGVHGRRIDPGDRAVEARRRGDVIADLQRVLHFGLLGRLLPLAPHAEEHRHRKATIRTGNRSSIGEVSPQVIWTVVCG